MYKDTSELLKAITGGISDAETAARVEEVFLNTDLNRRALTRLVYDTKRGANNSTFFNTAYAQMYPAESLKKKRFLNFGPGTFRHPYWTNVDKRLEGRTWTESRGRGSVDHIDVAWDMYDRCAVEVDNDSVEVAYASHIVEHAWDDDVRFFFKDVHRVLKPGGVFRVTAPNIDLGLGAARRDDRGYYGAGEFLRGDAGKARTFGKEQDRYPIEYYVVEQCSLLVDKRNPKTIEPSECASWLWQNQDVYKTLDLSSELSSRELNLTLGRHVNWFTPEKALRMLKEAGFSEVVLSGYSQSVCPVLRDLRFFDNTQPSMSFYVDAVK